MSGDDSPAPAGKQRVQDRPRERRTLFGIGAAARLVDEHQRARRGAFQNLFDMHDMRRERGEVLFDGLAVSDVAPHAVEYGKARSLRRGHEQTARRHQAEQPAHFERDRLAARIRARNEQEFIPFPHRERDGHGGVPIEQRVPAFEDFHNAVSVQNGLDAFQPIPVLRAGIEAVRLGKHFRIAFEFGAHSAHRAGKLGKNALDLFALVQHERTQFVVHFQHFLGFDEHRRAALRAVVDKPADTALIFRLDGNDVSVSAHRDDALLQIFALFAAEIALQAGADTLAQKADLRTERIQPFARVVGKFVFV